MACEKYDSTLRFNLARLRQFCLRSVIRMLGRWQPMSSPREGYSLIIGCAASMVKVLSANLALLQKQDCENLREVILVFDVRRERLGWGVEEALRRRFDDLPLRFVYYSPMQARVLDTIGWAWVYCWFNWCLGIAACRTYYALLHDLDALLLRSDILEQRYQVIRDRGDQYLGVRYYQGNGITAEDGLVVTFEMAFDATWLRNHFRPIDLFNYLARLDGRRVEFDTFQYVQHVRGRASVLPIETADMVHPSQLVCQYVELNRRRRYIPPATNNLPLMPYYWHLGGDTDALEEHRQALDQAQGVEVPLFGQPMDLSLLSARHWQWLLKQARQVEMALVGEVRPEVEAYFQALGRLLERRDQTSLDDSAARSAEPESVTEQVGSG